MPFFQVPSFQVFKFFKWGISLTCIRYHTSIKLSTVLSTFFQYLQVSKSLVYWLHPREKKTRKEGKLKMFFLVDYYCQSIEDSSTSYEVLQEIKKEFEQATGLFILQIVEAPNRETMLDGMAIAAIGEDECN